MKRHSFRCIWAILWFICIDTLEADNNKVRVNKCCEENELYLDKHCTNIQDTNETLWQPVFTTEKGYTNQQVAYQ